MKKKYLSESKIFLLACPLLVNDTIIEFIIGGYKFGWARVGSLQYKFLNGILVIVFIAGYIYFIKSYLSVLKTIKIYHMILYFVLWAIVFFIHLLSQKISLGVALGYTIHAFFAFFLLKNLAIE
jgi:hypothetical protein